MSRGAEVLARMEASNAVIAEPEPTPEEPIVEAPVEGEEPDPNSPPAPTEPAPAPEPEKKFAPQFAALAKREARVVAKEREARATLSRERDAFERERASLARDREELAEFKTVLRDPEKFMAYAHRRGMTGDQLAAYYAGEGSKENDVSRSVAELREELAAEKRQREEDRLRGMQGQQVAIEQDFVRIARDEKSYPYANAVYEPREILAIAKEELQLARQEGIDISSIPDSAVMEAVEMRAKVRAERLSKLQPSSREPAPNGAPLRSTSGATANGARTLTNGQAAAASSPRVAAATREERVAAIKRRLG